jgi:NADPH:quinone reductase-like Zn-dependent oxidoreductase
MSIFPHFNNTLLRVTCVSACALPPPTFQDKTILIHAGAGGVGSFAIQLAKVGQRTVVPQ